MPSFSLRKKVFLGEAQPHLLCLGRSSSGEGEAPPEMAPVPGYHVNVLVHPDHEAAYRAALADVLIDPEPETPHVKYAGCA